MILLCGIPSEPPLRLVIEAAGRLGVPYVLFNQREVQFADIHLEIKQGQLCGAIRIREIDWPLEGFSGVYVRLMDYRDLPEFKSRNGVPPDHKIKSQLFHGTLGQWLEMADCLVMNRERAMSSNSSKPYQAQFIKRAGFRIPTTLITNDPEEVKSFLKTHGRVIYKSISSVRSIVQTLSDIKLDHLHKIRHLPTQFQEFVPGRDIRVHVVGNRVFATEIDSEAVDYRYARNDGHDVELIPIELPEAIKTRCLTLSSLLDLPLCGIDLKRTPDDDYYCFEVNPSPAYSYYQENTGQDIAAAIVMDLHGTNLKSREIRPEIGGGFNDCASC